MDGPIMEGSIADIMVGAIYTKVPPALDMLQSALEKQQERVSADLNGMKKAASDFQSYLQGIENLPYSPICGNWQGDGSEASAQFGGAPYCQFSVTLQNPVLRAAINEHGQVTNAALSLTMVEDVVGQCPYAALGEKSHSYSGGGTTSGTKINLTLNPSGGNQPSASPTFNGEVINGRLVGNIVVHRTGVGGNLAWTVQISTQ
jgi:hypothetical protein